MPDPSLVDKLETATEKLYRLYGQADLQVDTEVQDVDRTSEAIFAASQWQLMWRKFRRNRAAMIGLWMIVLIYLMAAIGDFLVPYTLTTRFRKFIYMQPQALHFFYQGRFLLHVTEVDLKIDENLKKVYTPLPDKPVPIKFFVKGEPYKLFGLIPADIHLFGAEGENIVALLGTDRQGRDMFSRLILGSQISLTIGLIGTFR
jgi:peptide/nickel transport system permease protein